MDQEASESKLERPLGPGEVIVFSKQNYEGQEQLVTADTSLLDFPAASLRVGPKTGVTVFIGENYQGLSQELTTDLNSFTGSRLPDQPISLKVWSASGKPFTGLWAIEVKVGEESAEGRYLSAGLDGLLMTSPRVSEREMFRITEGLTGWASARYLALVQPPLSGGSKPLPDPHTGDQYRATAKLNVREGPGLNFKAVGYLQSNEIAEVLEANADKSWLRIHRKPDAREAALGRRKVALSLPDIPLTELASTLQPRPLFIQDLENLTLVDEPEAGFRKFSLLSQDNRWVCYSPEGNHFLTSAEAEERTIFCQSIKLAEDETQVGELFQGEVALYENPAYWGKAWVFYTDYADFDRVLDLNDEVSSIQLGPLTGVTIYRGAQFTADDKDKGEGKQDVISNLSSLAMEQVGEDQISSMQIWRIVPPGGSDVKVQCCLSQDFHTVEGDFKEYSAYRTTLRLPPTVETVEVWATDQTEIEVDDKKYPVSEDQSVVLKPNLAWCLVITTDAIGDFGGSLRAPGLKIRTDTMQPHERIVVFPDQEAHEKLAGKLKEDPDAMWKAEYVDENGTTHKVIERSDDPEIAEVQRVNAVEAQRMIRRVMSTVKYSEGNPGTRIQTISPPDELHKRGWVLYFHTYIVTADTLYVRQGPGRGFESVGFLQKNDIVEPLEFKSDGGWIKVRRLSDGLTGWSSSRYLKTGERYRVTARKLHLREGPGTKFPSLGYITANEIVTNIGVNEDGTWRQIRRSDGSTGWSAARYFALLPSPPLPTVSGLPQTVNYQGVSQGDVQALLAVAQFPDSDLAQGLFSDIISAVKKAVSITVSTVKDSLTIIVEMVDKAVAWVVDTAEKVFAFVEGIFEKIGTLIKDVIQWLRDVFDWDNILETRDYLRENINQWLDDLTSLAQTLAPQLNKKVSEYFDSAKDLIMSSLKDAIVALGGNPSNGGTPPSITSSSIPKEEPSKIPDTIEWILSKVMGSGSGGNAVVFDAIGTSGANLLNFWDDALAKGLRDNIAAIPGGMADILSSLVKKPDEPLLAVAKLLDIFSQQIERLVDFVEEILLGLINLAGDLVSHAKNLLNAEIYIPFISDLGNWVGLRLPAFSILDAATLILAIPVTALIKFVTKVTIWDIVGCVSDVLGSLFSIPLDITPEPANDTGGKETVTEGTRGGKDVLGLSKTFLSILEGFTFFFTIGSLFSRWKDYISDLIKPEESNGDPKPGFLEHALFGLEMFLLSADIISILTAIFKDQKIERSKRYEPFSIKLTSLLGVVHIGLLVANNLPSKKDAGNVTVAAVAAVAVAIAADVVTTLPEVFSFLRLEEYFKLSGTLYVILGLDLLAAVVPIPALFVEVVTRPDRSSQLL